MGCGDSKIEDGDHANDAERVVLGGNLDPKERILVKCGGVFLTSAKETEIECLMFYPDHAVNGKGACNLLSRHLKQRTDLPQWTGVRVQFKEFDSPDDVYKDWYERANVVPGVLGNTCASPFGSWVNLNPNTYQSRFVLPNGRRMWSPGADSGNYHFSVPQRLFRLYNGYDTEDKRKTMTSLMKRVHKVLPHVKAALVKQGIVGPMQALFFNPDDVIEPLLEELPAFEHYNTVHEICHPDLQDLKEILGEMEDNLMYNWFQIQSMADLQIGAFQEKLEDGEVKHKKTLWDRGLGFAVDGADKTAEILRFATHTGVERKMDEMTKKWVNRPDEEDYEDEEDDDLDADRALSFLFPDLDELVNAATNNITARACGLTTDNLKVTEDPAEVEEILAELRSMDAVPRSQKRRQLYERIAGNCKDAMDSMAEQSEASGIDGMSEEHQQIIQSVARVPHMIKYHFMPYTFFCVFPFYDETTDSASRRPSSATLVLWPTGLSREHAECQRIPMADLLIDYTKKKDEPMAADLGTGLFEGEGASDVDTDDDDDPRSNWVSYATSDFRGFEATATVALDLTYNFYFEFDGVNFLDHDSWCTKEGKIQYRRARFETRCGHVSLNPIKQMGIVI